MTLVINLLFGLGAVLIVSAIEDQSIVDTVSHLWNGGTGSASLGGGGGHDTKQSALIPSTLTYQQASVQSYVNRS